MAGQVCIYCWRTERQVSFDREHIIPESIHGRLALQDHVCVECNRWLGAHVDHHILRIPDILAAQAEFAGKTTHDRVLKHNFNVRLVSGTGAEFLAHAKGQHLELLTQAHPIHGMIYAQSSARESLRKHLRREYRGRIEQDKLEEELERICQWLAEAPHGEELHSPLFASAFKKYAETLQAKVEPKATPNVKPLIAKIAYEFIFFTAFNKLFTTTDLARRLLETITSSEREQKVFVNRIKPRFQQLQPFHFIKFFRYGDYARVDVGFYGFVHYVLFAAVVLPKDFFQNLSEHFDFPEMVGIQYEYHFANSAHGFWAFGTDGRTKALTG
ncbi:MAG: hypothetical protein JXQ75_22110 [Phycisphaerae bacterium]|nr:hypothetical protein [Phycisphaerae bacterium]